MSPKITVFCKMPGGIQTSQNISKPLGIHNRTKLTLASLQICISKWVKYKEVINIRQISIIKSKHVTFDMACHNNTLGELYTTQS